MRSEGLPKGLNDYQIKMMFITPTMILLVLMNIFPLLSSLQSFSANPAREVYWVA